MDSAKNLKNFKRLDHQGQLWILKSVPMSESSTKYCDPFSVLLIVILERAR